jgi:preprotein translocase subunit YajC
MGSFAAVSTLLGASWMAQAMPDANGSASAMNAVAQYAPFVAMFAVIYFLLIRPSQTQRKEQIDMLAALKKDDEVVTSAGILGRIVAVDDKVITLDIGDRVKLRVLRDRIVGLHKGSK